MAAPAEEQRSGARADDVDGGAEAGHLALGDVDAAARHGQPAGNGPDDRHFEAVEDPAWTAPWS
jgi:hypothetical protein